MMPWLSLKTEEQQYSTAYIMSYLKVRKQFGQLNSAKPHILLAGTGSYFFLHRWQRDTYNKPSAHRWMLNMGRAQSGCDLGVVRRHTLFLWGTYRHQSLSHDSQANWCMTEGIWFAWAWSNIRLLSSVNGRTRRRAPSSCKHVCAC